MTIKCYDEKKPCPNRKAGLCFNPCVLKTEKAGLSVRKPVDTGKLKDITQEVL